MSTQLSEPVLQSSLQGADTHHAASVPGTKPLSQSSRGSASDLPSWTALFETNSSDEDGRHSESRATTPEVEGKDTEDTTTQDAATPSRKRVQFHVKQPCRTDTSYCTRPSPLSTHLPLTWLSPQTVSVSPSPVKNFLKRKRNEALEVVVPARPSPVKRGKVSVPAEVSQVLRTTKAETQFIDAVVIPTPATRKSEDAKTSPLAEVTARIAPASALRRPPCAVKPSLPITEDSSAEEWRYVDEALETHVAPVSFLTRPPQSPPHDDIGRGLMHVLQQFADAGKGDKGKARAQAGWTVPRWSNVGKFKERLDRMYGVGDINRGLGRGPKNIKAREYTEADELGSAPDTTEQLDVAATQDTATEDEDDPDLLLAGAHRSRLEKPVPGEEIPASGRRGTASPSPAIV